MGVMPQVRISPYIASGPSSPTGIINQGQTYVPVQLIDNTGGQNTDSDYIWTMTNLENDGRSFLLEIGDLSYTGVDDQGALIASDDPTRNVRWFAYRPEKCYSQEYDGYTTIVNYDINSGPVIGWSVSGSSDTAPIVVGQLKSSGPDSTECNPSELFEFVTR